MQESMSWADVAALGMVVGGFVVAGTLIDQNDRQSRANEANRNARVQKYLQTTQLTPAERTDVFAAAAKGPVKEHCNFPDADVSAICIKGMQLYWPNEPIRTQEEIKKSQELENKRSEEEMLLLLLSGTIATTLPPSPR